MLLCSMQVATVHSTRTIYDLPAPSPPMGLGEVPGTQVLLQLQWQQRQQLQALSFLYSRPATTRAIVHCLP